VARALSAGNDWQKDASINWRYVIIDTLRSLRVLDGAVIDDLERAKATQYVLSLPVEQQRTVLRRGQWRQLASTPEVASSTQLLQGERRTRDTATFEACRRHRCGRCAIAPSSPCVERRVMREQSR
jgi:hypothetical protein